MKRIKTILVSVIVMFTLVATTSCQKGDLPRIGGVVSAQVGPIRITLGFGGYGNYYDPYYMPAGVNTSVAYIMSVPMNQNAISVSDQSGRPMGTVDCVTGYWQDTNAMFRFLRNWDYSKGPCPVLVRWNQRYTYASWDGYIVG